MASMTRWSEGSEAIALRDDEQTLCAAGEPGLVANVDICRLTVGRFFDPDNSHASVSIAAQMCALFIAAPLPAECLRSFEHESGTAQVQGSIPPNVPDLRLNDDFDNPVYQLKLLRSAGRK
jgi:hypothetical protein